MTAIDWLSIDIIVKGGPVMIPIIGCSIIALAICLERFFSLRRARVEAQDFMDTVRTVLQAGKVNEAINLCDRTGGPVAHIVKAGLLKIGSGKEAIREAMESAGELEIPRLERYLNALATVGTVSPMLGLLGTVAGLVECFYTIQSKNGPANPQELAGGIYNALITTVGGLVVAIPTIIAHNYFVSRVESMVLEMEIASSELLDLVSATERDYSAPLLETGRRARREVEEY